MNFGKRMCILGLASLLLFYVSTASFGGDNICIPAITTLLLSETNTASTESDCAILIAGQSLGQGVYWQNSGIAEVIDNADFRMKTKCSSISFVNAATGGSAADCAITQHSEDLQLPQNCWINHSPDYLDGDRHGNALLTAKTEVDMTMTQNKKRIIAIIWSQGEIDSFYITKTFSRYGLVTEPPDLCSQNVYCKAAYKNNIAEIFDVLTHIERVRFYEI
ncbi:hypothetical protein KKHLCK_04390 [Candidatus Electrothrix laxa]